MGDSKWLRSSFVYIILIVAVIALWFTFVNGNGDREKVDFDTVVAAIQTGEVEKLSQTEGDQTVRVEYVERAGKNDVETRLPPGSTLLETLDGYGISLADPRYSDVTIESKGA